MTDCPTASRSAPGVSRRGLRRARQLEEGVSLHPTVLPKLAPWAERLGVPVPVPD